MGSAGTVVPAADEFAPRGTLVNIGEKVVPASTPTSTEGTSPETCTATTRRAVAVVASLVIASSSGSTAKPESGGVWPACGEKKYAAIATY